METNKSNFSAVVLSALLLLPAVAIPITSYSDSQSDSAIPVALEITGPSRVGAGDLVVLNVNRDSAQWLVFPPVNSVAINDGQKLIWSSGTVGEYKIVVATEGPSIETYTVTIVDLATEILANRLDTLIARVPGDPQETLIELRRVAQVFLDVAADAETNDLTPDDMILQTARDLQIVLGDRVIDWQPVRQGIAEIMRTSNLDTTDDHILIWRRIGMALLTTT